MHPECGLHEEDIILAELLQSGFVRGAVETFAVHACPAANDDSALPGLLERLDG